MIEDLHGLTDLGAELCRRARERGVYLIWRAQSRSVRRALVRRGQTEDSGVSSVGGHGLQVFTEEGATALASRDDFRPEPAETLLDAVCEAAAAGAGLGLSPAAPPALEPLVDRRIPERLEAFGEVDLAAVSRRLTELEREIGDRVPGLALRTSYRADLDAWRIFRSDGTDVTFAMPRCNLVMQATSGGDGPRHSVSAAIHGPGPDIPFDEERVGRFLARAETAARLARDLPDAPNHPAGSFPLVIDYALAKGLAHEAFGHASEADGFRSSILARDGKFRSGDQVGASHVSIVDEPVEHDHAWQPFSANGLRREPAVIVDHGRLADALSDPWSAAPAGVRITGAARAESFRNAPQPRMTNIRIEVDDPLPAPGRFEDYGPEEVRDLLAGAGVFERHPEVVFLSGYSGGQVNTASGDFVFNCKAIYRLGRDGIKLYKPAIFSGSMFGALKSIREAFGPLMLDALGYCGKWGQSVPSSGGSHYFLVLDPDPTVRLGGS
jgi:TldD protein